MFSLCYWQLDHDNASVRQSGILCEKSKIYPQNWTFCQQLREWYTISCSASVLTVTIKRKLCVFFITHLSSQSYWSKNQSILSWCGGTCLEPQGINRLKWEDHTFEDSLGNFVRDLKIKRTGDVAQWFNALVKSLIKQHNNNRTKPSF